MKFEQEDPPQRGECSRVSRSMKAKAEETVSVAQSSMGSGAQRPKNSGKSWGKGQVTLA